MGVKGAILKETIGSLPKGAKFELAGNVFVSKDHGTVFTPDLVDEVRFEFYFEESELGPSKDRKG